MAHQVWGYYRDPMTVAEQSAAYEANQIVVNKKRSDSVFFMICNDFISRLLSSSQVDLQISPSPNPDFRNA
ncbi:hypothetical protein B932_0824 [Gluconobacter oxydans H24]|nr:hypothetical protein B932_0824 [Gluconobacter oxydans H24]